MVKVFLRAFSVKQNVWNSPRGVAFEAWGIATGKLQLLEAPQKKTDGIEFVRDDNQEGQSCAFEMLELGSTTKEWNSRVPFENQQKPLKEVSFRVKPFLAWKVTYKLH